ncbi:MAG: hypothetical protein KGL93_07275 [Gemmatimonadota bacterium]|nr:hypothetical protein [Gemmatimonadota bacterium]
MRQVKAWTVVLASVAYVIVGMGTATLARAASSPAGVKAWRLAAWLFSLAVFGIHLAIERGRGGRRLSVAIHVACAVALGACALAALGPVRGHWGEPHFLKLTALSLVAWPILTGVPAFAVALVVGVVLDRAETGTR